MTETTKYTKGPWWSSGAANVYAKVDIPETPMQRAHVADVYIAGDGADVLPVEQRLANARLISAAPEMAEATTLSNTVLEGVLPLIPEPMADQVRKCIAANRAALQKAGIEL